MPEFVLYRKYRPSDFGEVVGQEHVVKTLRNAVAQDMVAHAYLFAGPKGTGKTSIARILAKTINCERRSQKGELCHECQSCVDITRGRALDIIEIDAASNRGIDEIRELREGIRMTPTQLKYKVYIIDEAHQLTKEAFNALLKTLEEPPEHAIFVLATTSPEKMPETILSRVQRFDFKKFSVDEIVSKLRKILKTEGIAAEEEALSMIAAASEGSLRDAETMLTQILSHSPQKVTKETVEEILGVVGFEKVSAFVGLLLKKDLRQTIVYLHAMEEQGARPEEFLKSTLNYLRRAMLLKVDPHLADVIAGELTQGQLSGMLSHAEQFSREELEKTLRAFMEAQDNMRKTPIALLPLELALMKLLNHES